MDPRNYAYITYKTTTPHTWSNVTGYQQITVSKLDENNTISSEEKIWNQLFTFTDDSNKIDKNTNHLKEI